MNEDFKVNAYKEVMRNYPTGVTVITAVNEDNQPIGLTVSSFTSVSIDPLLISWSIDNKVTTYPDFIKTNKFAVHVLAEDQEELCKLFATKGADRFNNCRWELSNQGLPILADTAGVLQCETFKAVEAGDHMIMIGKVVEIDKSDKKPLLYYNRKFGGIPKDF